MKHILTTFLSVLAIQATNADEYWNQFRGPQGNGISTATNLPVEFDEAKSVRWKVAIPESGWSSPVVWGDEVWLTTGSDEKKELRAICVDLKKGKILRAIKVFDMIERKVDPAYAFDSPHLNSPATPTPVVEEDRVFLSFGSQGIACLDRKTGDTIWERRDLRIYQPVRQGSSPIVDNSNLYVAYDGTDQQFFVALDKATGETRWKTDRNVGTEPIGRRGGKPGDNKKSFATATLIEVDGRRQLIAPAAEATISYAPETGRELWRVLHPGGFNVAARPIYASGMVYVFTSGLNSLLMGIRPDGMGNVTDTHIAWSTTRSTPNIPSPVIVNDLLFMVTDRGGIARCLDARSGEEFWKKRLGGDHWASPLYAGGKLYFSSKQGDVTVLPALRQEPGIVARNKLNGSFMASPAVAGESLILRSTTHLYCLARGFKRSDEQLAADVYPDRSKPEKTALTADEDIGWEKAYSLLLKENPGVREKVESGGATKEQVIAWMKQQARSKGKRGGK
jgi:outer membrane protein assembly factor BamB